MTHLVKNIAIIMSFNANKVNRLLYNDNKNTLKSVQTLILSCIHDFNETEYFV